MTGPVLCAIDVSEPQADTTVLKRAARLAELDGVALDVIAVVPDFGMSMVGSFFAEEHHSQMVEEARTRLKGVVEGALGSEADSQVRHLVATGSVYDEILKAAEAAGSGLIVIGAHKPDFKDYLLGPNAARVVRHAKTSVMVIRGD